MYQHKKIAFGRFQGHTLLVDPRVDPQHTGVGTFECLRDPPGESESAAWDRDGWNALLPAKDKRQTMDRWRK